MDLGEIIRGIRYNVNNTEGQTNQDFRGPSEDPDRHLRDAVNEAYRFEVNKAITSASRLFFRREEAFTWPASATEFTIPEHLRGIEIEAIRDDTSVAPGPVLTVYDDLTSGGSGLYRKDTDTWGWNPAPGSAKSLVAVYVAPAERLVALGDRPRLMPVQHHDLLIWTGSILLLQRADQDTPRSWSAHQKELRSMWLKTVVSGSPRRYPPNRIQNPKSDFL